MRHMHLHLISDSTGETVSSVARAALAQFDDVEVDEHTWSLIRTSRQLEKALNTIQEKPGVVMYTLVQRELRDQVKQLCHRLKIPCIPVLARPVTEISAYLGMETSTEPGRQHELTEDYFSRVECINFALAHDDGQNAWELEDADIVIVGVSRTSKSPTCIYLAYRGYKATNIPFVSGCPLPENLENLNRPMVIGLTIDPERLMQIRKSRLHAIDESAGETNYIDIEQVKEEVKESRRLYAKNGWASIDVTRRSVEETAAQIIQYYAKHVEKRMAHAVSNQAN